MRPHLRTRAESEPLITWDNLWMLPAGYLILCLLMLWAGYRLAKWRGRK